MAEAIAVEFGKVLAIETAKSVMQLVTARPLEEIRLAWGFKDQLQKLTHKILYIKAFLEDKGSAKRETKVLLVYRWLQNVKDMVYSAEDFMDEYAYEILRRQLERNGNASRRRFRTMFKRSNRIRLRIQMTHKVGKILAKFHELIKEAKEFGIKPGFLAIEACKSDSDDNMIEYANILMQVRKDAGAGADASEFIGRKLDQEKLLQMICSPANNNSGLSVMAIVGMGGNFSSF